MTRPGRDEAPAPGIDPVAFRGVAGRFATGVTVVTSGVDGDHHAMTANSFTSVSLDPVLALVSVDRAARFHDVVLRGGVFGVSVLAEDQQEAAQWFAVRGRAHDLSQFAEHPHRFGDRTGVVLLERALATIECTTYAVHEAGDHTLVIGEVVAMALPRPEDRPLVFFAGAYRSLAD
ncbi:MAG TPA: flavin reductase family protein [Mycobacteriales bacterium]|nr:flavin reductase family protein [Mycobacteriales bacterium]